MGTRRNRSGTPEAPGHETERRLHSHTGSTTTEYLQSPEEARVRGEAEQFWAEKGQEATVRGQQGPRTEDVNDTGLSGTRTVPRQARSPSCQLAVLCVQAGSVVMFTL